MVKERPYKWELKKVGAGDEQNLASLLDQGWEPFAVSAPYVFGKQIIHEKVFLRRKIFKD